jgi:anti-anti-sigma factor
MRGLVEEVDVTSNAGGTEVRLSRRVGRTPVRTTPLSAPTPTPVAETPIFYVEITKLVDDIDLGNANSLYRDLIDGMRADAGGLVVDLSEVRHIDSAGVRMLHKLAGWLAQRRLELRVVVPDVSSIRRVLELSGIDAHVSLTSTVEFAVSEITRASGRLHASDVAAE